jgi:NAD(P)H-flavin reductase
MEKFEKKAIVLPEIYQVQSVIQETPDSFTLALTKRAQGEIPAFLPGQFNMLYAFGLGEVPVSISGDPNCKQELVHTIRAVGAVTAGIVKLSKGDEIGVRGPFGIPWPLELANCDVLVIAGGLGLAPLRPALFHLAAQRSKGHPIIWCSHPG